MSTPLDEWLQPDHRTKLDGLWKMLQSNGSLGLATGPYPVSHGESHVTKVMKSIAKCLQAIHLESSFRAKDDVAVGECVFDLAVAILIHDLAMGAVNLLTKTGDRAQREMHADIERLASYLKVLNVEAYASGEHFHAVTLIAWAHAGDPRFSASDKLNWIDFQGQNAGRFHLPLSARLLRFADLVDVGPHRLNPIPSDVTLRDDQKVHRELHSLVEVTIGPDRVEVRPARLTPGAANRPSPAVVHAVAQLRAEIHGQLLALNPWLVGWKLSDQLEDQIWRVRYVHNQSEHRSEGLRVAVVLGDRREVPPETPGDFFVASPSPRDITWLLATGLPKSTVIWNDKIASAMLDSNGIPDYIGDRDLIIIGSPYCNLFARKVNHTAFFRFNIERQCLNSISELEQMIVGLHRKDPYLKQYYDQLTAKCPYASLLMKLRGTGFVDPIHDQHQVGANCGKDTDYATVCFCRHPYSPERRAILVAGLHLPGTMAAVLQLSDPSFFAGRPLGGIIKVDIPAGEWYERVTRASAELFTREYTIEEYVRSFENPEQFGTIHGNRVFENSEVINYRKDAMCHTDLTLSDFLTSVRV